MSNIVKQSVVFEGSDLAVIEYKGRAAWLAGQVGRALGYSKNGERLVTLIKEKWDEEMVEGHDYVILRDKELKQFRELTELPPRQGGSSDAVKVHAFAPKVMLLFEPGLHFCCLKTKKPVGVRLRRFLVDEVMPQLVRDGRYLPERTVEDIDPLASRRLALEESREARADRLSRAEELRTLVSGLHDLDLVGDKVYAAYLVVAGEIASEQNLSALKPTIEDNWLSPTEISKRYGVSVQRIGRVISELGLRGNLPGISRGIVNKAKGHNRMVVSYQYSPEAVAQIALAIGKSEETPEQPCLYLLNSDRTLEC